MSDLKFFLLGSPQFEQRGKPLPLKRRKAIALLAYLTVTDQPHSRESLATMFWPDYDASRGRANLRRELTAINKALGAGWLIADREQVAFQHQAGFWLDVQQFQQLIAAGTPIVDSAQLNQAISLYRDDFLAGFTLPNAPDFDEWQFFQAEGLRRQLAHTLEQLIDGLSHQEDFEQAIHHARRWLALDPLHEPAHRTLMQLYHQAGQQAAALRQYETCIQVLDEELGVLPEVETTTLYEAIKAQRFVVPLLPEPAANAKAPPLQAKADEPAHLAAPPAPNLPLQSTPFIGREEELTQIEHLLQEETDCRLLTIVGPGGMGKTRLALQVTENCLAAYPDGVYFVPLAPVSETTFLIPAILEALNLPSVSGNDPQTQLLDYLRSKQMLLLLDNFEHLLDGADLLSEIIAAAPQVQLLTTSRERLNLPEEWGFDLEGLQLLTPETATLDDLPGSDAANLFLQSAKRAKANFAPTAADMPHIIRICQAVGGMPLGLELAAPWIRLMSCQEIAQEIEANLDFLSTSMRQIPERHRSLRAVFDYSWQRLTPAEQTTFSKLSVFRGGCTREAAQAVAGASLQTLLQLVDKSLLRRTSTSRYEVHELLRQYGEAFLKQRQEYAQTQQRHSRFFLSWLGKKTTDLKNHQQEVALKAIASDIGNVHIAWQFAVTEQHVATLGEATICLLIFNEYQGRFKEGADAFRQAAEALLTNSVHMAERSPEEALSKEQQIVLGQLRAAQGWFSTRLGLREQSQIQYQRGISLLRQAQPDAPRELATMLFFQGAAYYLWREFDQALFILEESHAIFKDLDDQWGQGIVLAIQGLTSQYQKFHPDPNVKRLLLDAIALLKAIGERRIMTYALNDLGIMALWQGEFQPAKQYLLEVLQIRQEINDLVGIAYTHGALGLVAISTGNLNQAQQHFEQSLVIRRELGNRSEIAQSLYGLGKIAQLIGDYQQAEKYYQAALEISYETKITVYGGENLTGLGYLAYILADYIQAEKYLLESLTIWQHHISVNLLIATTDKSYLILLPRNDLTKHTPDASHILYV